MPNKKEPLSIIAVKTLLAVIIFAGIGTIIIGGGWLVGKQGKVQNPVIKTGGLEILVDGNLKTVSNIQLPIDVTEAEKIVKEFCEPENSDYKYDYISIKKVNNEWRIPITNLNCPCYATVNVGTGETSCMKQIPFGTEKEVTITTDKTEYELGETGNIVVRNNSDNLIKHLKGVGCGLQGFSNKEWRNVSSRSCRWDGENKLKPNSEYNFNWTIWKWGLGKKYRIVFYYQEQKIIKTKEKTIGKIICESENFPEELEKLLSDGNWIIGDVLNPGKECVMCDACGCSCTMKNAWYVNEEAVIDEHLVSCFGSSYIIKYRGKEYTCVSKNYKQQILTPSKNWEKIYSNEFTIKEKSALDSRCSEKVVSEGNCPGAWLGYEFDQNKGICVKKGVSGCSYKTPFKTLKECQKVCEKKENNAFPDEDKLVRCENNSDCVLVDPEKCDCNNCKTKAINKKYLNVWNKFQAEQECHLEIVCPMEAMICGQHEAKCDNNKCVAVKESFTKPN